MTTGHRRLAASLDATAFDRVYTNAGNPPLIDLLDSQSCKVLDVGCGAGDNAALVEARGFRCEVFGITRSPAEAEIARRYLQHCWVFDVEDGVPEELGKHTFDVLMFSHVMEHLRNPSTVLARLTKLLDPGGVVLIAVPNVLFWRQRVQFLLGRFEYQAAGIMDVTHLRFFTFLTADRYLLADTPELRVVFKDVTGSVPLWALRRYLLPRRLSSLFDDVGCRVLPNLFGSQVLIKAVKR